MTRDEIAGLRAQAGTARAERRFDVARDFEQQAADAFAALGDAAGQAHARRHVADVLAEAGNPEAADAVYAEVLVHYRDELTGDAANTFRAAAVNAERLGDVAAARIRWERAREAYLAEDAWFRERTGGNPGAEEAERRLAALKAASA